MRIFIAAAGKFLCVMAVILCFSPKPAYADGEEAAASSDSSSNIGLGLFTRFPLTVSAYVRGGYDDNINTTHSDRVDSMFVNTGLALGYEGGSPRTKLSLSTTTAFTYYANASGSNKYEPDLNLTASLTHLVSARLSVSLQAYVAYQVEPDFQYGLGTNRRAGNYFVTQDKLAATYMWTPRFSTATTYQFGAVHYDSIEAGFFEDYISNTIGNEFRFLAWPTTTAVAEYRFQVVSYEYINNDSTTNFLLGGLDHTFSPRLNASFRAGIEFRDYENTGGQNSPYFEGTVNYKVGKDTSVSWVTRYGIEEADITLNQTRKTFRTGLEGSRAVTARISATLAAYYTHDDYQAANNGAVVNPGFVENTFDLALYLRYALSHTFGVEAGYDYTGVSSGETLRDYTRSRVWGGVNVRF